MSETKTIYLAVTVPADEYPNEYFGQLSTRLQNELDERVTGYVQVNTYIDADAIKDEADRIKRAAYFSHARSIADDLADEIKAGRITDRETAIESLEQACDSSYYVTYTHAIFEVLRYSAHHNAYTEEMGEAPVEDGDIKWSALAYMALRQDVLDYLSALDIGINADDLGVGRNEEDEDEEDAE